MKLDKYKQNKTTNELSPTQFTEFPLELLRSQNHAELLSATTVINSIVHSALT